jgi:putative PIN family toxin of toxin-antitoxin system
MRVVLDTNVLVSALLLESSLPAQLVAEFRRGRFVLLTSALQLDEFRRVTRYPKIRSRINAVDAGSLMNDLRKIAVVVEDLPGVDVSRDPFDNFLLAIASGGGADYLVTGDKPDLLALNRHDGTKIISVRDFVTLTRQFP